MASMLAKHTSVFFLILFFSALAVADNQIDYSEVFSKYISPSSLELKQEKLSHLHFYFHDITSGKNATAFRVAEAPSTNNSSSFFGATVMIDDPLTIKPDVNSKIVGRAQGMYAFASQSEFSLLMVLNFAFTEGKYNGSTLSVLGRNFPPCGRCRSLVGVGFSGFLVAMLRRGLTRTVQSILLWSIMFMYSIINNEFALLV